MGFSYKGAGVDIDAGNQLVQRIKTAVHETHHEHILGGLGGFAGLASVPSKFRDPVLVFGTDGVGTKLALAEKYDRHESIGQDLVAMCVNDILIPGAEPFVFLDYFATGRLNVDVAEKVIKGIAKACTQAGCALGGGETAEMPGFYADSQYDLAGFAIGIAERENLLRVENVSEGDVLIGLPSVGPHSNGYALIRKLLERSSPSMNVLEQLLAPTTIYTEPVLSVLPLICGMCHITGGGFQDNLPRAFPNHLAAHIEHTTWERHECFEWIQREGSIDTLEMYRTFNCGIGLVLICKEAHEHELQSRLRASRIDAVVMGRLTDKDKQPKPKTLVVAHGRMEMH